MASIEEIRSAIAEGNKQLRQEVQHDIEKQVAALIKNTVDERFKEHEERIFAQIKAVQDRASVLEAQMAGGAQAQGNAWKRYRSEPKSFGNKDETKCAVLTGFPKNLRKSDIETFVKNQLAATEQWANLKCYAPNIRGTVCIIKLESRSEVTKFVNEWKDEDIKYRNEHSIRARFERPPEKRKSNSKIYLMTEYLNMNHKGIDFDPDFKHGCVWMGEIGSVVSWSTDDGAFQWDDTVMKSGGINVDRVRAEEHTQRQ